MCDGEQSLGSNTFYTWTKALYYLILPIMNLPAPPSQNYPVAPLLTKWVTRGLKGMGVKERSYMYKSSTLLVFENKKKMFF